MYCIKSITETITWVGASDRRAVLFENGYPTPNGISHNSYLVMDEKTVLLGAVDESVSGVFFENITYALGGRSLDYLILNHIELNHAAVINELLHRYKNVRILCNAMVKSKLTQLLDATLEDNIHVIMEDTTLNVGKHTFALSSQETYEITEKILFSADTFGSFCALGGHVFADEIDLDDGYTYMDAARRYYVAIASERKPQIQALLKKAALLDIAAICPSHGYIWRKKDIGRILGKYAKWSDYSPETNGVLIAYASECENTETAANILACRLADLGICSRMYDVSTIHHSYIIAAGFKYSHMVFAFSAYNAEAFANTKNLLHRLAESGLENRTVAFIENGAWTIANDDSICDIVSGLKNVTLLNQTANIQPSLKPAKQETLDFLAAALNVSITDGIKRSDYAKYIENSAMFALSYGLFVLSAKNGVKYGGCIINTVIQVTDTPKRIAIAVNKGNYTHDLISRTGLFNVSTLSQHAQFSVFQHFGFQSGRDIDKFADYEGIARSSNGLYYITDAANAYISGRVTTMIDLGTHTMFIADVTEAKSISSVPSATYQYYFDHIKPKPKPAATVKGFVCKICGYVYDGDTLPADFICPICKHGAEDFEPLE